MGIEVQDPAGLVVSAATASPSTTSDLVSVSPPPLPDAGFFTWRTQGLDDAGVSAWSAPLTCLLDDTPPPNPANFAVTVDGGVAYLSADPTSDSQSGLKYYHFVLSTLAPVGFPTTGDARFQNPTPFAAIRLGPGTWSFALHAHDRVDNYSALTGAQAGPVSIPVTPGADAPHAPLARRGDAGAYPDFPWVPSATPRWLSDAGTSATAFVLTISRPDSGVWELIDESPTLPMNPSLSDGEWDVRLAAHHGLAVSDWGPSTRLWVDTKDPNAPVPVATRDGGSIVVTWPRGRDTTGGSGVREYVVTRCCRPTLPSIPNLVNTVGQTSFVVSDVPGPGRWTYSVQALDRASNVSVAGTTTPIDLEPVAPLPIRADPPVGNSFVSLLWPDDTDGTWTNQWNVRRIELSTDAGTVIASGLTTPRFDDTTVPEGAWRYEVETVVDLVVGPPGVSSDVLVDRTAPVIDGPRVLRTGARSAHLEWTASDALSGLSFVQLERETDGVVSVVTAATSAPFDDAPIDGSHRYRVVATDVAGNQTTTAFSPVFITPGAGVAIAPVTSVAATCGRTVELQLSASEPVTWSVSGPASVDDQGVLRWTPTRDDVGAQQFEVTATGATSADRVTVELEVTCESKHFGLGCTTFDGVFVLAAVLLLLRRRHGREGTRTPTPCGTRF